MIGRIKALAARALLARRFDGDPSSIALMSVGGTVLLRQPGSRRGRFRFEGLPFEARPADWCAVEEVLGAREYAFVQPLIAGRTRPVVVDLGANIGTFGLFVLSVAPDAVVLSVEPSAATFAVLDDNCRASGASWRAWQVAVAAERGTARFSNHPISSSSRLGDDGDQTVATVGLAEVLAEAGDHVDLLKVDVEGGEEDVLAGREDLLARVDHVVVELHPGRCAVDRVTATLRRRYRNLFDVPGRVSSKPLICATDADLDLPRFGA